jgi:uncharacterized membrane protein YuzA (DUF378 family)
MTDGEAGGYRGLPGAFPYALRRSDSWLFRSYAVVGGVAAALVALLVALGLVVLLAATASARGGTLTLSRSFYVLVGLAVVAPLVAPVLLAARRHRRGDGDAGYDAAVGAAGYLVLGSLYVGLVATVPESQQADPAGALAPLVRALYDLPPASGAVPPAVATGLLALVHRLRG